MNDNVKQLIEDMKMPIENIRKEYWNNDSIRGSSLEIWIGLLIPRWNKLIEELKKDYK